MADEAAPSGSSSSAAADNARLAAEASAATAAERPQGGGTAARAAAAAAGVEDGGGAGGGAPLVLRIKPNPSLSGPPPVFMRQAQGARSTLNLCFLSYWVLVAMQLMMHLLHQLVGPIVAELGVSHGIGKGTCSPCVQARMCRRAASRPAAAAAGWHHGASSRGGRSGCSMMTSSPHSRSCLCHDRMKAK